jgi:hypothetical protein
MPYRRLPNTDSARLKALDIALKKGKELPPFKLAFSQGAFGKLQSLIPSYLTALSEYRNSYTLQVEKNKNYLKHERKLRLYLSHFIQVVNMAIQRGELPVNTRNYFELDKDERKLPSLKTDEELIHCSQKLIEGEKARRMEGLTGITNPTIALVKVQFEKFLEVYNFQSSLKRRTQRAQESLSQNRNNADHAIQQVWNEVENTFRELPESLRREKSSEYGIHYVFRKNEIGQLAHFPALNMTTTG